MSVRSNVPRPVDIAITDHPGMAHYDLSMMGIDDETLRMIALPLRTTSYLNALNSPSISMPLSTMRVSKPLSPRRRLCRRMTFNSGDVNQRFALLQPPQQQSQQYRVPPKKCPSTSRRHHPEVTSSRPVSWHASSYIPIPPCENSQASSAPQSETYHSQQSFQLPSTLSGYFTSPISPGSISSPELLPINESESPNNYCPDPVMPTSFYASDSTFLADQSWPLESLPPSSCYYPDQLQSPFGKEDSFSYFHLNWNTPHPRHMDKNVMDLPPTPHDTLPCLSDHAVCLPEDAPPIHDQNKEEDEILIGMGLYDHPESVKSSFVPPYDLFCSHPTSELTLAKTAYEESQGRGLKLEERYIPPISDDEEDDENEDVDEEELNKNKEIN
ncbi:putative cell morphogenesis protein las1 [Golovinomyces cichoracearum]|uniref:Putative cell morphogenesis protein las1 n=1 Tax=Golovinomyces cichoracearum TaxID=62708 RepID=A0A420IKP7_9PEZI|nr:putative cell morphogenesis protein las1 [Golovinomyces cichoracearum]